MSTIRCLASVVSLKLSAITQIMYGFSPSNTIAASFSTWSNSPVLFAVSTPDGIPFGIFSVRVYFLVWGAIILCLPGFLLPDYSDC